MFVYWLVTRFTNLSEMINKKVCCFISGVCILFSVFLLYDVFPRLWLTGFTTDFSQTRKGLWMPSFGEQKALDNSRTLNLEQAVQTGKNERERNKSTQKQGSVRANDKIKTGKQTTSRLQVRYETGTNKSVIQNEFLNLSQRMKRKEKDQQVRDAIQIYHERNFIKPKNETCTKKFPICILVGVYKCGTHEIVDFLHLHPHIKIYPSVLKAYEMPYFSKSYNKGDDWLRNEMPCTFSNQITLMKHSHYFHDPAVPERIKHFNESIKLILMVREPVSRSMSDYRMKLNLNLENPNSNKKYAKHNFSSFVLNANGSEVAETDPFVRLSVYDKPMKLWLKYFDLSQFLIMDNDEFKHDPVSVLNKVENFLGLEHFITDKMFVLNKDKGFYCIRSNITDSGMACYSEYRGKPKHYVVSENTLTKLRNYFQSKNKRFFKIIGRSFDWN